MELGDKGNDEIGQWRQEYKPKPIFPPNLPTNPCPKVPMKSKENYSTIPMKNHTFRVRRYAFKNTFMTMVEGPHGCLRWQTKWHIELFGGCKGLLAAD